MTRPHNSRATAAVAIAAAAALGTTRALAAVEGKNYLRTLDITTQDGKDFLWGRANSLQWDVMEFAEMMDWD
jgi:hypothetical protein